MEYFSLNVKYLCGLYIQNLGIAFHKMLICHHGSKKTKRKTKAKKEGRRVVTLCIQECAGLASEN